MAKIDINKGDSDRKTIVLIRDLEEGTPPGPAKIGDEITLHSSRARYLVNAKYATYKVAETKPVETKPAKETNPKDTPK